MVRRKRYQKGHLYKTGKRRQVWRARWVEPVVLANGTVGRVLRNEFIAEVRDVPTRREAQALLDEKLRNLNQGAHKPQAVIRFRELFEQHWAPKVLPTFKPSTAETYLILWHKHLSPYFGGSQLCDLRTADVQAFVVEKAQAGLAWNSVKNLRNLLSRILRTAVEWGFLSSNPARGIRLPAEQPSRPPKVINVEQLHALLRELSEPLRTMVLLCVFTGVRAGELFALRWRHADFERGVLQVRESVYKGKFGSPKTRHSVRDLPLGNVVLAALVALRKRTSRSSPDDLLFSTRKGTPRCRNNLLRRFVYPACDRAGIPKVGWHSLRHLHATLLSEAGQPLKVAQAQLGHADLQTTLSVYTHLLPDSQRHAVQRIESLVFPNFPKFGAEQATTKEGAFRIQ